MNCGKRNYSSEKEAINIIKRRKKFGYIISSNLYSYKCPRCQNWHIGHDKVNDHKGYVK